LDRFCAYRATGKEAPARITITEATITNSTSVYPWRRRDVRRAPER